MPSARSRSRSSSVTSGRGARLCPAQKCRSPVAVRMATRTSPSSQISFHAAESSSDVWRSSTLALSGLLIVTYATFLSLWKSMLMGCLLKNCLVGVTVGDIGYAEVLYWSEAFMIFSS